MLFMLAVEQTLHVHDYIDTAIGCMLSSMLVYSRASRFGRYSSIVGPSLLIETMRRIGASRYFE